MSASAWLGLWLVVRAATPDTVQWMNCPRQAAEYQAQLEGVLVLHEAFVGPAASRDVVIRDSVLHQVKYVWGYWRNHPDEQKRLKGVLSAEAPRVEILCGGQHHVRKHI